MRWPHHQSEIWMTEEPTSIATEGVEHDLLAEAGPLDRKRRALAEHPSQTMTVAKAMGEECYPAVDQPGGVSSTHRRRTGRGNRVARPRGDAMTATDAAATAVPAAAQPSPLRQAISDTLPFAIALIPFGLAAGGAATTTGLSVAEAMFGAIVMLAGAAQLAAIDAIGANAGPATVVMVVALINLRFVLYGAGVASWFADASRGRRLILAYPVVDQTFLLCQQRFEHQTELAWRQRYYTAATFVLGGTFVGAQLVSYQLGASLPDSVGLHLAAPLAFTGLLARSITGRRTLLAALVAAAAFAVAGRIAGPLVLPIAVTMGVSAALLIGTER